MSGFFGRIVLIGSIFATVVGIAGLRAQTQLSDPKDAQRIFASTCSACHKSPQGLAKSGQVAGFLRQHYTTGPEMSASMAAYLVSAGSAPAAKKGKDEPKTAALTGDNPAAKGKQKKQDQTGTQPTPERSAPVDTKGAKAKQLQQAKANEERAPIHPSPASAADAVARQATVAVAPSAAPGESKPAAAPDGTPLVTFDIPLPDMPDAPPVGLTQSVFSSSPVP